MRVCFTCKETKPIEDFPTYTAGKYTGIRRDCKPCRTNKINANANAKYAQDAKTRTQAASKSAKWRKNNPESYYKYKIRYSARHLGLDEEEIMAHYEQHSGKCDICGGDPSQGSSRLVIDHCHLTQKFRGLLCHNCNLGIGNLKDSIDLVEKALVYLKTNLQQPTS